MRIALCVHGFPPEPAGATELAVQALARALADAGDEVLVVTGSLRGAGELRIERETAVDPGSSSGFQVARILRGDLHIEHWHKSQHPLVSRAFRELLREERIELVHVHHWLRLSDDLVLAAARERVPALVSLHDHFVDCLLRSRVDPRTKMPCELGAGPSVCVPCAGTVPPRTRWIPVETQWMLFEKRRERILRELRLARSRIAPSRAHAESLARFLGPTVAELAFEILATPAEDSGASPDELVLRTRELYRAALEAGPPDASALPREEWFAARLAEAELAHWDEALSRSVT